MGVCSIGDSNAKGSLAFGDVVSQNEEQLLVNFKTNHVYSFFSMHSCCGNEKFSLFFQNPNPRKHLLILEKEEGGERERETLM